MAIWKNRLNKERKNVCNEVRIHVVPDNFLLKVEDTVPKDDAPITKLNMYKLAAVHVKKSMRSSWMRC